MWTQKFVGLIDWFEAESWDQKRGRIMRNVIHTDEVVPEAGALKKI